MARVRRRILQASAVLLFIVLAGATYQGVATALERRQFPHPGQLADVGGHQLHLHCTGDGSPTVILEAPAAGMSAAWGWVQPAVAEETRVCSYDRAGLGWSEAGSDVFSPTNVPAQLPVLLDRAGERAPFIVVGHGLGAAFARLHAERLGPDAAALVLIDAPVEGQPSRADSLGVGAGAPWLARTGLLRASGRLAQQAAGLPEPWSGALASFLHRPDHLTRAAQELARSGEIVRRASAAAVPEALPIVSVTTPADAGPFLDDRRHASAVLDAIRGAIVKVRERS